MFFITVLKGSVNLYYGTETKLFGMQMVHNDQFVTWAMVVGIVINFFFRLCTGKFEELLGFGGLYFLNIILNICISLSPLLINDPSLALICFVLFQRTSNGNTHFYSESIVEYFTKIQ